MTQPTTPGGSGDEHGGLSDSLVASPLDIPSGQGSWRGTRVFLIGGKARSSFWTPKGKGNSRSGPGWALPLHGGHLSRNRPHLPSEGCQPGVGGSQVVTHPSIAVGWMAMAVNYYCPHWRGRTWGGGGGQPTHSAHSGIRVV